MRSLITLLLPMTFLSACVCKSSPYELVRLEVSYPNLSGPANLYDVRFVKDNPGTVVDTVFVDELNSANGFSAFVDMSDMAYEHLLNVEGTTHSDQITAIEVKRDRCGNAIKKLEFYLNGSPNSGKELIIE